MAVLRKEGTLQSKGGAEVGENHGSKKNDVWVEVAQKESHNVPSKKPHIEIQTKIKRMQSTTHKTKANFFLINACTRFHQSVRNRIPLEIF